jgi:GT2 family glycosyltransferase
MTTAPRVSIIIVSWNTSDLLSECLMSLPRDGTTEVIVVDNGSRDGTLAMLREWPQVQVIANAENEGFTRANNMAIRRSRGEFLLLINSDARLSPGCLDRMLAQLAADPHAGAVGPRLVYPDGTWQRWTAGRAPSLRAATNYYLFLERLFPGRRWSRGLFLGQDVRAPFQPDWVCSACMLLRRSALDQVGLLNERYFVYMDDIDLCQRLRDAGWHVWYYPDAEAVHIAGQSTKRQTGQVSREALRSFNRYFAHHHGRGAETVVRAVEAAGFALRALAYLAASQVWRRERRLGEMARAHWTYFETSLETRNSTTRGRNLK